MKNIKIIVLLTVFCLLGVSTVWAKQQPPGPLAMKKKYVGADINIPVKGDTLIKGEFQWELMNLVYTYAMLGGCGYKSIADTKIAIPEKNGEWVETWTVACHGDKNMDVPVKIVDNKKQKTISFNILMNIPDHRAKKVKPTVYGFTYSYE